MNNYNIAGGRNIWAKNNISAIDDLMVNNLFKEWYLDISHTSTFTGKISTPHIYTKTQVNQLLTRIATSTDITSAISREPINQQHIPTQM